ncbi:hypothetical protein ALT1545_190049 [Alteromonas macleodii]
MFKQISLFGINLAFITLLFSFYAAWHEEIHLTLINNVLNSVTFFMAFTCHFQQTCS